MSFGWIDPALFSINSILLMDRWLLRQVADNSGTDFRTHLGNALSGNPAVLWYVLERCPERADYFRSLLPPNDKAPAQDLLRESELYIVNELDWAIVYVYPDLMETLPYIRMWDTERLLSMTSFAGKLVLDIGSGTGRLAFAAATLAKHVFASEPVVRLREYLREKKSRIGVSNVTVLDGTIEDLPFMDRSIDIIVTGHVVGNDYERELQEMDRVLNDGGLMIDCPGEDDRKRPEGPSERLIGLGFSYSHYVTKSGGDVFRYWRRKSSSAHAN